MSEVTDLLPGLVPRHEWARKALNKCDGTAKRLQDAGKIVVRYIGQQPYVDISATAERLRDEGRRSRRGRAA